MSMSSQLSVWPSVLPGLLLGVTPADPLQGIPAQHDLVGWNRCLERMAKPAVHHEGEAYQEIMDEST